MPAGLFVTTESTNQVWSTYGSRSIVVPEYLSYYTRLLDLQFENNTIVVFIQIKYTEILGSGCVMGTQRYLRPGFQLKDCKSLHVE